MTTYPTCVVPGCEGHVGKYDNCLSMALWNLGQDYADESGGDSCDGDGYHMLFLFTSNTWISGMSLELAGTPDFQVAGDTYVIVSETRSGHVSLAGYMDASEARGVFDDLMAEYGKWSEIHEY